MATTNIAETLRQYWTTRTSAAAGRCPTRYYTKVFEEKGATIRIVWIDTTPLIDKYRNESDKYPDAYKQDISKQLLWLESVLASAKEDWIIVAGHHPI